MEDPSEFTSMVDAEISKRILDHFNNFTWLKRKKETSCDAAMDHPFIPEMMKMPGEIVNDRNNSDAGNQQVNGFSGNFVKTGQISRVEASRPDQKLGFGQSWNHN